jgi:hypothetical protein
MAENKKSFILYADLIHTVKKMPKDKAGELFLIILQYVNDENPVVEDMVIDLVFEPIKRQMKRDLKKYEGKKKQWSDAGKASAEAKKQAKALAGNASTKSTDVNGRSTDSTVNDTVTVNVNDNVFHIESNFSILLSNQIWVNKTKEVYKLDDTRFKIAMDEFKAQNIVAGKVKSYLELMDHFSKWYPVVKETLFKNQSTQKKYNKV